MPLPKRLTVGIKDVIFGQNVTLVEPVNLYRCTIDDECFIGPFVEIQNDVHIGSGSRVQSHSFICTGTTVGKNCFIGHGAMFINDTFKNGKVSFNPKDWVGAIVEDDVIIGTHATIMPVRIAKGSVIGAGAVVTRPIVKKGIYAGNPAKLLRELD